jgi:ubiquitin carboxyl-terminal hydrolase 5/13
MLADIDDPIQLDAPTGGSKVVGPTADEIALLAAMGFTDAQARKALLETVRSVVGHERVI